MEQPSSLTFFWILKYACWSAFYEKRCAEINDRECYQLFVWIREAADHPWNVPGIRHYVVWFLPVSIVWWLPSGPLNSDTPVGDVSEFLFVEMLDGGRCSSVFSLRKQPFCPVQIVVLVEGEIEGRVSIASTASEYPLANFEIFRSHTRKFKIACWDSPKPL